MRILHLTLKKKWFDMIASGEKKEEYREIKDYWRIRLTNKDWDLGRFIKFDRVIFKNGYNPDSPTVILKDIKIKEGEGKPEWGAEPGKKYFVIELGEIIKG